MGRPNQNTGVKVRMILQKKAVGAVGGGFRPLVSFLIIFSSGLSRASKEGPNSAVDGLAWC